MYEKLKQQFKNEFGHEARWIVSAPGRTELGGNHTDHQNGRVLAAAVNLRAMAAAAPNNTGRIRVLSRGFGMSEITLPAGESSCAEYGTTASLIRGIAARFVRMGCIVHGFDAFVESDVLPGSGLSSSAAFEVLIANIINHMENCSLGSLEIARISQYAENVYFGKPSGLMDQTASSCGGVIAVDFADPEKPLVRPVAYDFESSGHALCIIDSGADHAELTDCYAAITEEMAAVSGFFGAKVLREVPEEAFYKNAADVRRAAGDRAVLRAMHFFEENRRVVLETGALENGNFGEFLKLVSASGRSSWMLLQNVIPEGRSSKQELAFALALAGHLLGERGAFRVHGGGFAGTIQAFVPRDMLENFRGEIERVLGKDSCHVLSVSPAGGSVLEEIR
ncbi:MAG: galactokinase [Candidatus Limivicinus sp.]|jgi:galactokinase